MGQHTLLVILRELRQIFRNSFYAYIIHDKDENKTLHIHFVLNCVGSRSIRSICEVLECDYQDVQIARRPRSAIRYLIHIDNKEKYQYDRGEIITNNLDRLNFYFSSLNRSISDIYQDLKRIKTGQLSADQFVELYSTEFANLPFYQKIKTLEVIDKMSYK